MRDIVTIREAVARAKNDGIPVSEYTLRAWVRSGEIQARKAGNKILLYYPNLIKYLQCANSDDNTT